MRLRLAVLVAALAVAFSVFCGAAVAEENDFIGLLNEYRADNGLSRLTVSDQLTEAATRHSSDMAAYGFFSHYTQGSDWFSVGSDPSARMRASGYDTSQGWGEVIAAGYFTAKDVLAAWQASPPHNSALLGPNLRSVGVGLVRAPGSEWSIYWTVDLGGYAEPPTTTTTVPVTTTTTVAPTTTTTRPSNSPAAMMDELILGPHNSAVTGEWAQNIYRFYGIPPHCLLTVIGAETSMGDPRYGGRLITEGHHNYGCMRFAGYTSKWGMLATGSVVVAGKLWYSFPSMEQGMMALGRYLKVGPASDPGYYLRCFKRGDWAAFASVYYGRGVPGYQQYVANLRAIDAHVRAVAADAGYLW